MYYTINKEVVMNDINQVVIAGRLTEDAVLRQSGNGNPFVTFSIANNRYRKNSKGESDKEAAFFKVIYFPSEGETPESFLKKGLPVHLEGRLGWKTYTAKDGSRREEVSILAQALKVVEKRPHAEAS